MLIPNLTNLRNLNRITNVHRYYSNFDQSIISDKESISDFLFD